METQRNIKINLAKAKEWYKKGGELREIALQAFTTEEIAGLHITKVKEGVKIKYKGLEFTIVDVDFAETYNWNCATIYADRLNCSLPDRAILECIRMFRDVIDEYLNDLDLNQTFWTNEITATDNNQAFSLSMDEDNVEDMFYTENKNFYNSIMLIK